MVTMVRWVSFGQWLDVSVMPKPKLGNPTQSEAQKCVPEHSTTGWKLQCFEVLAKCIWPCNRCSGKLLEASWRLCEVILWTSFGAAGRGSITHIKCSQCWKESSEDKADCKVGVGPAALFSLVNWCKKVLRIYVGQSTDKEDILWKFSSCISCHNRNILFNLLCASDLIVCLLLSLLIWIWYSRFWSSHLNMVCM